MSDVNVPGLGAVPQFFVAGFDGFNIEEYSNSTNAHNEDNFYGRCNRDDWANDDFIVSGAVTSSGYTMTVCMNSEVPLPLYNNGCTTLSYNAQTQKWDAMTGLTDNRLWRFCTAGEVVDLIVGGLECYASEGGAYGDELSALALSIAASRSSLVESTSQYPGSDCNVVVPTALERFLGGMSESNY